MNTSRHICAACCCAALASGAHAQAPTTTPAAASTSLKFQDITALTGIDMPMVSGAMPSTQILEVNGGGLALFDYDGDNDLDLFVANGATMSDTEHGPGCRLYENLGEMKFKDVTADKGIDIRRWAMGVAAADYDGDGRLDLHVCCFGPDVLLRNTGSGFEDATAKAGLGAAGWSTSCAFGDIDNDGDLDLYVVRYLEFDVNNLPPRVRFKGTEVMAGPQGMIATPDLLYRNNGDGTFTDITAASGVGSVRPAFGLNVVIVDFNLDGWQDIFVGNDSMANFLFRNQGNGTFAEDGMPSGIATNMDGAEQATMGIAIADINEDGLPDKFSTNFSSDTNTLHVSTKDGRFYNDATQQYGLGQISRPFLGWATGFFDFDHDGDEDVIIFNGHVYPEATRATMDSDYEQVPLLFERAQRFQRVTAEDGAGEIFSRAGRYRCAVFGDMDSDGDIDVTVGELNGPVHVLRNEQPHRDNWLIVDLLDRRAASRNRHGLGARLELIAAARTQRRWICSGGGFQSSSPASAHFALPPDLAKQSAELLVVWPDGFQQRLENIQLGRRIVVERSDASAIP